MKQKQLPILKFILFTFYGLMGLQASAQTDIIIGAGSNVATCANSVTADGGPMYNSGPSSSFVFSKSHYVYTAAELATNALPPGSLITKVAWYKANAATYSASTACIFEVYLNNSASTGVPTTVPVSLASVIAGATQAYATTSQSFSAAIGWVDFVFPTPFLYTGGALEVTTKWDVSAGGSSASGASAAFAWAKDPGTNTLSHCAGTQSPDFIYLRTTRAQIRITYIPGGPCTAPPTAGTSVSSAAGTICSGQNVSLSLSGSSNGTGQTYQWESSPTIGGPYTPFGSSSNSSGTSVAPTTTTYYRAAVTCSGQTDYSVPVVITVAPIFPGGIYTINSALSTGGSNFASFTDAINAIGCGISGPITLNVAPGSGPYNEQINIPATVGSNALNPVVINGNGATLTQTLTVATGNYATLNLDGADNFTFNDLNIEALGATYGFGVHIMNSADNNSFNNCNITASTTATGTTSGCVSMSGSTTVYTTAGQNGSNNVFTGCNLTGGYFGFMYYGSTPAGNTNNSIINCTVKEYYFYGSYNIQQGGATISGSTFERPTRLGLSTFYGILLTTGCTNMLVEKNIVRNAWNMAPTSTTASYALYCATDATPGNENRFINNLVYNINNNGIAYGLYFSGADYIKAYHNTISFEHTASTATGATYGLYSTGTVGGMDFKNNNIYITRGGTGLKYCLYFSGGLQSCNNNILYVNSSGGGNNVGYYSAAIPTFAAWQAANSSAWDGASQNQDPLFVSPATGNFSVGNLSLDDMGTPVGVTNDLIGNPRSLTTPDIGSLEFGNMPLETKIMTLSATNVGLRNRINWSTASEDKGDKFLIERSIDAGKNYNNVGAVIAKGEASKYTYWDEAPVNGINYYRIKTIDAAGKITHSRAVSATLKDAGSFKVEAFPNPVTDQLSIVVYEGSAMNAHITLTDITGKIVTQVNNPGSATTIDMSKFAKGIYVLKYADDDHQQTIRINKR